VKTGKAARLLNKFKAALRSRKAKTLPAGVRSSLTADAEAIRGALVALRRSGGAAS
jgi:hypothetical protein